MSIILEFSCWDLSERSVCKKMKCGHGDCVRTQEAPFYECKCHPPYRAPKCKKGKRLSPVSEIQLITFKMFISVVKSLGIFMTEFIKSFYDVRL